MPKTIEIKTWRRPPAVTLVLPGREPYNIYTYDEVMILLGALLDALPVFPEHRREMGIDK